MNESQYDKSKDDGMNEVYWLDATKGKSPGNNGAAFFDNLVWLNSNEAAKYLRKSANALRIMVHRGHVRPRRFRRRLYFRRIELDRLLETSL